jgi:chaperonin GroES
MIDIETVMGIMPKGTKAPKMLGDRVLLRRPKKEDFTQTQSKLWVPVGNEKQEVGGVVVAVGPGLYSHDRDRYLPMDFKIGDFVLFPKYGATDIKIGGVDHAVVRQDKVLAVVEGETDRIQFAG